MRIAIDLQGAQTESRFRGIGRYSLALSNAIARNRGKHEIVIALNGLFPDTVELVRSSFAGLLPAENIRLWYAPGPVFETDPSNNTRREIAERVREAFLASLKPDVILMTSLFEGWGDDAVTSAGVFDTHIPTAAILYDLIPLTNPDNHIRSNRLFQAYYSRKIASLKRCTRLLAISESSRKEAIDALRIPGQAIVNISGACDTSFRVLNLTDREKKDLLIRLGISRPFVMYTGGADERKNLHRLISAYAMLPKSVRREHQIVFAGKMPEQSIRDLHRTAFAEGLTEDEFLFTGFVRDEDLVRMYNCCELFVFPSLHEGFGLPPLEAMACGAPVIASARTSLPEVIGCDDAMFNPESVKSISDKIAEVLTTQHLRAKLAQHGLFQSRKFSWDVSAKTALDALSALENLERGNSAEYETDSIVNSLITSIRTVATCDDRQCCEIARCIAASIRQGNSAKRLFIDISELAQGDAKTGIQRVVRSLLRSMLNCAPQAYEIVPVYARLNSIGYFRANRFLGAFLGQGLSHDVSDDPVDFYAGDIFFGLDLQHHVVPAQKSVLQRMRQNGVRVIFVVYDLLGIHLPQYFPTGTKEMFRQWLSVIAESDGAICISKTVANELAEWMEINAPRRTRPFSIDWFHLGADIENSCPTYGIPSDAHQVLERLKDSISFLMVGTLEPRKGHTLVLSAFEQLWEQGEGTNLVIVGKQGWQVDELVDRLNCHPELNRRLFWLKGISDEYLEHVYASSRCLIAASEGEGFGLPLIEAAQHKLPIIARDIPVFREVAGEHAFYFRGTDSTALGSAIRQWLALFAGNQHPKSDRLPWLTWQQSASQLLERLLR